MSIDELLKKRLHAYSIQLIPVGGGSINETYKVITSQQTFFCKVNSATKFPHLFKKEAEGLHLIQKHNSIRTPEVIECFEKEDKQFLILEWINSGERTGNFWKLFGEQLASLHQVSNNYFGLDEDNYMGSVTQINKKHGDWNAFFIHQRIQPLIQQCRDQQLLRQAHVHLFDNLFKKIPQIFNVEKPSLLHGDLWSGNFMCDSNSNPVLIDPAVYFGHRCVDLGMTTLFGGFHQPFYEAYYYHFPLPGNYKEQWKVCNLYPLLIHLLLFGKSYLRQIETTLNDFQ